MTKQEIIQNLELAAKILEWEYSLEIVAAIDEAIKIVESSDYGE